MSTGFNYSVEGFVFDLQDERLVISPTKDKANYRGFNSRLFFLFQANDSMHACLKFINCAASSFYWPFRLKINDVFKPEVVEKQQIIQADEKLVIYLYTLNNLSHLTSVISSFKG
jgi:hypothetical protein